MKSTYILFPEKGRVTVEQEDVSLDDLKPLEVVVRNEASIISAGTELARLNGLEGLQFPCRPGYGSVGRVLAIGSGVTDFKADDRVFYAGKHASVQRFMHGQDHQWGLLFPVPEALSASDAVFACMAQIAMTAPNITELALSDTVAVFGLGLVGNLAAQLYRLAGARVIGIDPVARRCELAKKVGIETVIDVPPERQVEALKELTQGKGAAVTVDAVGHSAIINNCVEGTALFGQVILLGSPRAPFSANMTPMMSQIHIRGLVVRGAHMWRLVPNDLRGAKHSVAWALRTVFDLIGSGKLNVRALTQPIVKPADVPAAYAGLQSEPEKYVGVVIDWRA
jgi:2-desacetyl-2-hydroxyethyl bacteriochlorophyllide A dehydrogenase